ncbi:uncharacterized protein BXZ73DRAFT_56289 [Epithele typhae]|uniref:uncharacterized protein n=1 Tax=Epithele typhae TaxID=378194 RepID=UPI0020087E82|nr:uncharacterized protein BXZ73DRAFT_56289 [Epithele typhae]KAH9912356.1 hypothetical protein BXZ73DRAFT_56289 [Epithele typhae]
MSLVSLDDDTTIYLFCVLPVDAILNLRKTCKRLAAISRLHFVWQTVCRRDVLDDGLPFPQGGLSDHHGSDLEHLTLHALKLGRFWLNPSMETARTLDFQASTGTGLSHVFFLPGRGGRYVLTVYKGIWSMITCWDVGVAIPSNPSPSPPRRLADWSPRQTIFAGFVVNSDTTSEAALAVSILHGSGTHSIELLAIRNIDGAGESGFRSICNIATSFRPIALDGDLVAFSDEGSETVVMNWRDNTFALLKGSEDVVTERFKLNRCLYVVLARHSVLVVRARLIELFPSPMLQPTSGECPTYGPIGTHSFGWIDGVAVAPQDSTREASTTGDQPRPLSIVLRAESDDPWASDAHRLEQFVLAPNPAFVPAPPLPEPALESAFEFAHAPPHAPDPPPPLPPPPPYLFPPTRVERTSPTLRGFLRSRAIALGRAGTALWIQPRAAHAAHLTGLDVHASDVDFLGIGTGLGLGGGVGPARASGQGAETLCAAVFDGPLRRGLGAGAGTRARTLCVQRREGAHWTTFDYDEEAGRVALGANDGTVTVLDLA